MKEPISWFNKETWKNIPNLNSELQNRLSKLVKKTNSSCRTIDYSNFKYHPNNEKIVFITQYHDSKNEDRDNEIINSINLNISNSQIDKVLLFTQDLSYEDVKDKIDISDKVTILNIRERISYQFIFEYIYNNFPEDHSTTYVLSNSDCYFDESLETLRYINFKDRFSPLFLAMTRHEYINGELDIGKNPFIEKWSDSEFFGGKKFSFSEYDKLPYLEPWSSDAWAFKLDTVNYIKNLFHKFDYFLGTNLCEILLIDNLIKIGVDCKNVGIGGYIKCIHNHESLYREKVNIGKKIEDYIPGIVPNSDSGITRNKENSINDCFRIISKANWIDSPEQKHSYSDFFVKDLSPYLHDPLFRYQSEASSTKNVKLLDIHKEKHHITGWKCIREQFKEQNPNASYFSNSPFIQDSIYLVSFMSEFIINPKINEKRSKFEILKSNPWIGIDHLVNTPGPYYQDMWKGQPHSSLDLINKYKELDLLDNCKALIFMSKNQQLYASKFEALENIPTFGLLHPIVNNNPPPTFDFEIYKTEKREVVQLGWSQRNHSFFNNLPLDPNVFNKHFMFGSRNCYKTQSLMEDLEYHNSTLSCKVLPMLPDDTCNQILSQSIVFLNLYDAIANNGILDCIERNTPVIVNRSPSSEEYLGEEYPLFYENSDSVEKILKLFSDEKILEAHNYLCNLDKSKFNINIFMKGIEDIVKNV